MSWDLSSEEVITAKLESQQTVIFAFSKKIKELEKELEQQRFNNKHNLSIDQTVADKIKELEKELELRSSWVKHHQKCVEANSVREHKLEDKIKDLEAKLSDCLKIDSSMAAIAAMINPKIEELEKRLVLSDCLYETQSLLCNDLLKKIAHLEKVCENSMDSEHGYAEYRKVFKLGKG